MDNKQKRVLLSLIYRTMIVITFICLVTTIFLSARRLYLQTSIVKWLDITLTTVASILLLLTLCDIVTTKKLDGKYTLAKCYYIIILLTFLATIALGIYVGMSDITFVDYLSYVLPIGLILGVEVFQVIYFIVGLKLTGLSRRTTITLDSTSPAPNFDDEIQLKKKLDTLNRKLEIKKLQDQIDDVEKKLDE